VRRSLPAPDPLPAVILHGGAAFPVIDLRQVFCLPSHLAAGGGSEPPGPERLILLLERPPRQAAAGEAAGRWALVVDDLLGLEPLAPGAVAALPAVYRGPERRWFSGVVPRAGGRVIVLLHPDGFVPAAAPRTGGAAC
jgi:chemotaxis signal transduction protein